MPKKAKQPKEKRLKPELAGGFRDYGPAEAIARDRIFQTVRKTFEDFGFDPMETPAVERTGILTSGDTDSGKIIFNVKGSKEKNADTSLRFDLTVPLARFIAANPDIPKPFKRYQIGKVWRGESPQAGRYREFSQADIDIVGAAGMGADSEIIAVMYRTLANLGISRFAIRVSNRKIMNGLPALLGFPANRLWELLRIIDKRDKIGDDGIKKEATKTFSKKIADSLAAFLTNKEEREKLLKNKTAEEGRLELDAVFENLSQMGIPTAKTENAPFVVADWSIVRGLGYYTGSVFETTLLDLPAIGSVFSGGRYDELIGRFTGNKIPAVGASIGIDRLFAALQELGKLPKRATTTKVLVLSLSPALSGEYLAIAAALRSASINTSVYLGDDRSFQAQLAYAVKKEIPYVVIYGDSEAQKGVVAIKNLVTREQREVQKENLVQFFKESR